MQRVEPDAACRRLAEGETPENADLPVPVVGEAR